MPAGLIENDDGMSAWRDRRSDLGQVCRHRIAVAAGHDQAGALAFGRADCTKDIGGLGALIAGRRRSCSAPRPSSGDLVLLAHPRFILEPQFYFGAGRERGPDFFEACGKVFLKASIASGSWS